MKSKVYVIKRQPKETNQGSFSKKYKAENFK